MKVDTNTPQMAKPEGIRPDWRKSEQDSLNAAAAQAGQTSKVLVHFPFQVKQIGPNEVEIQVTGLTEDPLSEACFGRLKGTLGEKEAFRIERKVAQLILREQLIALMEVM